MKVYLQTDGQSVVFLAYFWGCLLVPVQIKKESSIFLTNLRFFSNVHNFFKKLMSLAVGKEKYIVIKIQQVTDFFFTLFITA